MQGGETIPLCHNFSAAILWMEYRPNQTASRSLLWTEKRRRVYFPFNERQLRRLEASTAR